MVGGGGGWGNELGVVVVGSGEECGGLRRIGGSRVGVECRIG